MNLNKIIDLLDFNKLDADEVRHVAGRRGFFQTAGDLSVKVALAALPVALTMFPKTVKAQSSSVTDVLNFALTLEYLEDEFYKMGLNAGGLIPDAHKNIFMQISKHESAHVTFLKTALGSSAVTKPEFDFTAGGQFANAFTDYTTFLALSQSFEDTGVRAYKGQAGNLIGDKGTLKAALQIHSVEARHASEVRRLRGEVLGQSIKGWISGKESHGAPESIYAGEENITHAGASLNSISAISNISESAKTEAFDEPLTKEQVLAIVTPFLAV
jgi:rubrerythrin